MARVIFLTDFSEAYARELLLGMARYAHDTAQARGAFAGCRCRYATSSA